jgi:hypothetical protein
MWPKRLVAWIFQDLVYGHGKKIMEGHVAFESGIVSWQEKRREPFGAKGAHFPFIILYMYSICTVYTSTVYIIVNLVNLVPGEPVGAQSIVKTKTIDCP